MRNPINQRKVAVVGCGFVGAATAFTLMQSGLFSEMVLIDANFDKADGGHIAWHTLCRADEDIRGRL